MKTTVLTIMMGLIAIQAWGHASYTGYSGAPGRQSCSMSCHHKRNFAPTVTVTGFPQTYVPGQQYTIAVAHSGGTTIKQFNASVRVGIGSTNAGTLTTGTSTSIYNVGGETNGAHFSSSDQNSGTILWTAPSAGTGTVRFYWAGLQGNLSSGADTAIVLVSNENTTGIDDNTNLPQVLALAQNYPNPFNAETIIKFSLSQPGHAEISISNILGQQVYSWSDEIENPGPVALRWDGRSSQGNDLPSGVYFYRLRTSEGELTRQLTLLR